MTPFICKALFNASPLFDSFYKRVKSSFEFMNTAACVVIFYFPIT